MSTRKTTAFYAVLIAVASVAVGMVIASRMDLSPESTAQTLAVPAANSAPLTGPVDAQTFRDLCPGHAMESFFGENVECRTLHISAADVPNPRLHGNL